ncbi:hypothetical protein H696_06024 [Fonticula alba]|uniref:Metallo-beta-lactamase domain-containing protein n=1 Tax=Fonticula alba TaxID=691883 RepID=A0A058YZU4_FONAL|nr:hypothetical protein H696_06024 [Fonticula alba]KCV67504.1 hypothetical protein H696_06024 [Fonticula alba]|eukprot:XP_009498065.1 hypothetical protein H696_06024 [Fonticula alba]
MRPLVQCHNVGRFRRFGTTTSYWLFRIGDTVIDCGPSNVSARVDRLFRSFHADQAPTSVLVTHHHEDHTGNAGLLQARHQLPVYCTPMTSQIVQTGYFQEWYRLAIWGRFRAFSPTGVLGPSFDAGPDVGPLEPIHTPGHIFDHHAIFAPEHKILFAGDMFIARRRKAYRLDERPRVEIASLGRLVDTLPAGTRLYCAHRGDAMVEQDGAQLLRDRRDFLRGLRDTVVQEVTRELGSFDEVSELVSRRALAAAQGFRTRQRLVPAPPATGEEAAFLAAIEQTVRRLSERLLGREGFLALITAEDHANVNLIRGMLIDPRVDDGSAQLGLERFADPALLHE